MSRAQVEAKFRNSCAGGLPEKQQDEVIRQVMDVERLDSVAELMKNLQP
jgi:hypothetical protein